MAQSGLLTFAFLAIFGTHVAYAMDCSLGQSENILEKLIKTCPRPLIDSEEEKYCCWSPSGDKHTVHCCNVTDFVFNSISLALPIIIICLVVSFIVSCVCCLCCPFCCVYKRRSGGSCV